MVEDDLTEEQIGKLVERTDRTIRNWKNDELFIDGGIPERLSNKEILVLFDRMKQGDMKAREELISGNIELVIQCVKNNFMNTKYDKKELVLVGCLGLIKAVDNFSLEYNVMFSTYAVPLIIGEVKRFIRDSSAVRISRGIRDSAYKILKFKDEYQNIHGFDPSNKEICDALGIEEYELASSLESLMPTASIFDPIYNDGGDTIYLLDQIADKENGIDKDDKVSLDSALTKLNDRGRHVLMARYIYGKTQMEIADDLGVSQAQVSRIEKNAIRYLRRYMD